jgi:hypothetical protein
LNPAGVRGERKPRRLLILIAMKLDLDIHVGESHSIVGDAPQ